MAFTRTSEPVETLHLAALIDRLNYLERLDRERGGPTPSRDAEERAIAWALTRLQQLDPKCAALMARAEDRADERARKLQQARDSRDR